MASLAGFLPLTPTPLAVLGLEPAALELVMLMALLGRANGIGLVPPGFDEGVIGEPPEPSELGCCRMEKTNVLFSASR